MKRITIVSLAAAFAFAAVGCSKDKDKKADPAASGKIAEGGTALDTGAPASTGFAVFPADSEFVLHVSLDALRKSPMWAQWAPTFQAKIDEETKDIKATCGLDPVAKLSSVHIGGKPNDEKSM